MKRIGIILGFLFFFLTVSIFADSCITLPPFSGGRVLTNGEIIYLDTTDNKIKIFKYDEDSKTFYNLTEYNRPVETYDCLESADLNNSGTDEIILADASDDKIHNYDISSGGLLDIANYDKDIERYDDIAVGDVNGDGVKEVILGDASVDSSSGHSIKIFNYSSGSEIAYIKVSGGYERYDRVAAGDVDGDGVDEIVFGDASSDNIVIYKWNESAVGNFERVRQFNVDYSREDEIAVADVNGNGKAEIIFAEGATDARIEENRQRIIIFDENGSILGRSSDIDFRSEDTLTAGDITMNGRAEIVVGKDNDDMIHVYEVGNDFSIRQIAAFYVGYKKGEKLAVGDIDGDSLNVGDPICRGQATIDDEVVAVINAPPKHDGVNYEPGNFKVEYENVQGVTTTNKLTAVTGFTFSAGLSYKGDFGVVGVEAKLNTTYGESYESQSGTTLSTEIGQGVTADMRDRKVTISTTYDVFEYPVLDKNGNQIYVNGESQFLMVTVPVSIGVPTLTDYDSSIHELGDITSYPKQVSELINYPNQNIFDFNFWLSEDPSDAYIKKTSSNFNSSKTTSNLKVSAEAKVSAWGATLSVGGSYSQKKIRTHKIEFKETTSIKIHYDGGITDDDKKYNAHAVAYYDANDGHLVLDWMVPNFGEYYKQSSGGSWIGNLGNIGNIFNIGSIFNNPLLFNIPQLMSIVLPLPNGHNLYQYNDGQTNRDQDPANCKPVGYDVNSDNLTIFIDLPSFAQPVDLYFGLYMPDLDPNNIYILTSSNELIPVTQGLEPWMEFTSGNLIQNIFGQIPVSIIPEGTYYFYLLACPANASDPLQDYYIWGTTYIK